MQEAERQVWQRKKQLNAFLYWGNRKQGVKMGDLDGYLMHLMKASGVEVKEQEKAVREGEGRGKGQHPQHHHPFPLSTPPSHQRSTA